MIESAFQYICENAQYAYWIIFLLLLLSGLNLPISEDIVLLGGGAVASTCLSHDQGYVLQLYFWIFLGCYLAAWEGYWIGRLLGPNLYRFKLFRTLLTQERMERLRGYYAKYGVFTFIIGRFCPGGVRSALFLSSGLTKMPFGLFILRDGFACLISTCVLFNIGYHFAANIDKVFKNFQTYSFWFLIFFLMVISASLIYYGYTYYYKKKSNNN